MLNKTRTAIFGGTFNPIHNGHLSIAKCIMESGLTDELWLLVTPRNPWKEGKELIDDNIRLDMAAKATAHIPGVYASNYEFNLPIPSYTVNTMKSLVNDYPDREFILVIGADNWTAFNKWKDYEYFLKNHHIIVYPRPGYPITDTLPKGVTVLDMPLLDISSTMVLQKFKEGLPIEHLVPVNVQEELQRMQKFPPFCL